MTTTPHPTLVFDFDGTIADTFHAMVRIGNVLSSEFHFKSIAPDEVEALKDKSSKDIIRFLRIPFYKVPVIAARARIELYKEIERVKPLAGLKEILKQLKDSGYQMSILTSNSLDNVYQFLKRNDLDVFDFATACPKVFGKSHGLRSIIKNKRLLPAQIIYIGDETRDIEAARKAGVRVASVSWGYNSAKALKIFHPDWLFTSPKELLQLR